MAVAIGGWFIREPAHLAGQLASVAAALADVGIVEELEGLGDLSRVEDGLEVFLTALRAGGADLAAFQRVERCLVVVGDVELAVADLAEPLRGLEAGAALVVADGAGVVELVLHQGEDADGSAPVQIRVETGSSGGRIGSLAAGVLLGVAAKGLYDAYATGEPTEETVPDTEPTAADSETNSTGRETAAEATNGHQNDSDEPEHKLIEDPLDRLR